MSPFLPHKSPWPSLIKSYVPLDQHLCLCYSTERLSFQMPVRLNSPLDLGLSLCITSQRSLPWPLYPKQCPLSNYSVVSPACFFIAFVTSWHLTCLFCLLRENGSPIGVGVFVWLVYCYIVSTLKGAWSTLPQGGRTLLWDLNSRAHLPTISQGPHSRWAHPPSQICFMLSRMRASSHHKSGITESTFEDLLLGNLT